MADYMLMRPVTGSDFNYVRHTSTDTIIPFDPGNADYQAFLAWVAEGNVPDSPPILTRVVESVRPVAFRWALRQVPDPNGVESNALLVIENALKNPGLTEASEAFEYAVEYVREDLIALCAQLGFSTAMVDQVLSLAATRPGSGATYADINMSAQTGG